MFLENMKYPSKHLILFLYSNFQLSYTHDFFFTENIYILYIRGEDIFISLWNLHRSPSLWEDAEEFKPERWPLDSPDPNEVTENFK